MEKADDVEGAILQEVRKLSRHSLTECAQQQADRKAAEMPQLNPAASKDKKTVCWHSLFGEIEVVEQRFRHGRRGPSLRPCVVSAQVKNPGYSQRLERATVDFGADGAFAQAPQKLKEHYGIEIPISAAQPITEKHGAEIVQFQSGNRKTEIPPAPGVACVKAELDGSLIPIVNTAEPSPGRENVDRRRTRQLEWPEARLAMAHEAGSVTPRFAATLGRVEEAGNGSTASCGPEPELRPSFIAWEMAPRGFSTRWNCSLERKPAIWSTSLI